MESSDATTASPRTPSKGWRHLKRLLGYTRPYVGRLALALFALAVAAAASLTYPNYFGEAINAAVTAPSADDLDHTTALLLAVVWATSRTGAWQRRSKAYATGTCPGIAR